MQHIIAKISGLLDDLENLPLNAVTYQKRQEELLSKIREGLDFLYDSFSPTEATPNGITKIDRRFKQICKDREILSPEEFEKENLLMMFPDGSDEEIDPDSLDQAHSERKN